MGCFYNVKVWEWLWNWAIVKDWKDLQENNKESLNCLDQSVSRNLNIEDTASEGSKEVRDKCCKCHLVSSYYLQQSARGDKLGVTCGVKQKRNQDQ